MITINEVIILSIDKGDDSWAIEGEIIFDSQLATAFSVTYLTVEDEFEDFEIEIDPGQYDKRALKEKILSAAMEYEE